MASPLSRGDVSHRFPSVSIILTVVNEEAHLRSAVQAALNSDYVGKLEMVIAVGPSSDKTLEIAYEMASQDSRIRVIENPTGKTPNGLNAALQNSRHDIVVRIDGHSEIESHYIRTAVEILNETGAANVGGLMAAEGITPFQKAVARAMRSAIGVGASRFHTGGKAGVTDTVYLGVFRRNAIENIGGYDEKFIRAQDWEMNHRLKLSGGMVWFDPRLKVTYRPRSNVGSLARQYCDYGRWRRAVSRRHKGTINFRYLAPPINFLVCLASLVLGIFFNTLFMVPIFIYLTSIVVASLVIGKSWSERLRLPLVLIIMHFCWGFGFISSPKSLLPR